MAKVLRCRDAGMDCDVEIHAPERARDWIRPWNMRRRPITSRKSPLRLPKKRVRQFTTLIDRKELGRCSNN